MILMTGDRIHLDSESLTHWSSSGVSNSRRVTLRSLEIKV